ncbi:MAG: hypothetical protein PHO10_06975 [Gemmiger sp.]|nr:hypothetical protein [Gemmiger sp.]
MEAKSLFLLQDTEAFMQGELDNVTVAGGRIILDVVQGAYVPYGCYTSPAIPMPVFDTLYPSWNTDTPQGTAVEVQARVLVDGNWTAWCSFGRWSPFIRRLGGKPMARGPLVLAPDSLALDSKTATQAQLRIYLYTRDDKATPAVRLLGVSVRPAGQIPGGGRVVNTRLHLPPYAVSRRAPHLRSQMDLAIGLASLTNRWGADILPEEFALALFDWQNPGRPNLAFGAAVAGCWGFPAWVRWADLAALRAELRAGYGAVVPLATTPSQQAAGLPESRFVSLRGFVTDPTTGAQSVLLNDPLAETDFAAETTLPVDDFLVGWTNQALFLRPCRAPQEKARPARRLVSLQPAGPDAPGVYHLLLNGTPRLLADDFCGEATAPTGVLAWTVAGTTPHATTAHKTFHFTTPTAGGIALAPADPPARHTVYAIDATGQMLVGDITL